MPCEFCKAFVSAWFQHENTFQRWAADQECPRLSPWSKERLELSGEGWGSALTVRNDSSKVQILWERNQRTCTPWLAGIRQWTVSGEWHMSMQLTGQDTLHGCFVCEFYEIMGFSVHIPNSPLKRTIWEISTVSIAKVSTPFWTAVYL